MNPTPTLTLALLASTAALAAPITTTHSGYLVDAADHPLDVASQPLTFRVYDRSAPEAGETLEWKATCNVPIRHGFFSLVLGDAPCAGDEPLDTTDLPPGEPRWLEISVGDAVLAPRLTVNAWPVATAATLAVDTLLLGGNAPDASFMKTDDLAQAKLGAGTLGTHGHPATAVPDLAESAATALVAAGLDWQHVTSLDATTAWPGTADASRVIGGSSLFASRDHTHAALELTTDRLELARLHTGHGQGLDADLVDGKHADAFALAGHTHTATQLTDLAQAARSAVASGLVPGSLAVTGGLKPGTAATCDAANAGVLRYSQTAGQPEYCNGTTWTSLVTPGGSVSTAGTTCKAIREAGVTRSGAYWIDPDGVGGAAPYRAYCDLATDGGGWTVFMFVNAPLATPDLTQTVLNPAALTGYFYLPQAQFAALATPGRRVRAWGIHDPNLYMECDLQQAGTSYKTWVANANCVQRVAKVAGGYADLSRGNSGGFVYGSPYDTINPANPITDNSVFTKTHQGPYSLGWCMPGTPGDTTSNATYKWYYGDWVTNPAYAMVYAIR